MNIITRYFSKIFVAAMLMGIAETSAQTNPTAFALSGGSFSFTSQTATSTTYPTNLQGWNNGGTGNVATLPTVASTADITLAANANATTVGIGNLGANGFQFLSSGSAPNNVVGSLALALNTSGRTNVLVSWLAADQTSSASRSMNLTLQYRVGTSGAFTTVAGSTYTTSNNSQTAAQTFTNVALPAAANNQSVVHLRWIYYESASQSGSRDAVRLDEISVSSSAAPTADFVNIQFPSTQTITEGQTFPVYARVYEPGVTEAAGANANVNMQIGYSSTNSNPNGAGWTWLNTTYNVQAVNDDEYQVANFGSGLTAGTYYYASRVQISGGSFVYGGTSGVWASTANNGVLTVNADLIDFAFLQFPQTANIAQGQSVTIYARVFESGVTNGAGQGAGIVGMIGYSSSNTNPNGAGWTWVPATYNVDAGNDDEYQATIGAALPAGTYYYAARFRKSASATYFYAGWQGAWSNNSGVLTITAGPEMDVEGNDVPIADGDTTPSAADDTIIGVAAPGEELSKTFAIYNTGGANLTLGAITITGAGASSFYISSDPATPVPANGVTFFDVTFAPTVGGVFTATINIPNNDANENPYNFNVQGTATAVNDNCAEAQLLTVNAAATNADSIGATQSIASITCATFTGTANDDVWYSFTTSAAGSYIITVDGDASYDAVVDLRSGGCNGTNINCADATEDGGIETITATLAATTTYLIRVYDYDGDIPATTTFTIRVTTPPSTLSTNGTTTMTFPNTVAATPTVSQTFNLSGTGLTGAPGNITVTAPADFQVSANNMTWGSTALIPYTTSTLASTPVYVRFNPATSGAKSGNITFSGGGVTSPPTIAVSGTGVLTAPVAIAATNILQTSFTANWNAVAGATGYLLDVSTNANFGTPAPVLTESFTSATFPPTGWTNTNWTRSTTAADYVTGPAGATAAQNSGTLTTPAVATPSSLSFYLGRSSNATAKTLTVEVSTTSQTTGFTTVATYDHSNVPADSYNQYTVSLAAYSSAPTVFIRFVKSSATNSPWRLDDVVVTGLAPSFVTGYNNLAVGNGTSYNVTGLTENSTYYYRVRATDGTTPSANSNTISVTTKPSAVTWNGTAWSNVSGPDIDIEAIIAGVYNTNTNGEFTAKKVTVNSGSLTVVTGTDITIANDLVNNLAATAVVFENNANLIQINNVANSGPITVKRNSSALRRLDYTLWSSPVAGQNLLSFSPLTTVTPTSRFYQYNSATNVYNGITSPGSTTFNTAQGYLIRMPNNHPTFPWIWNGSFAGVPNNGNQTFDLFDGGAGFRFNLTGNPYPSPISAVTFVAANSTNITGTLYFWRETNNDTTNNAYCTWSPAGGGNGTFVSNGQPEAENPNGVIQTGQGFFVEANAAPADLVYNNLMRVNDHADQFFRMAENAAPAVDEAHRIWLNVTNANGQFCQTAFGYMTGATQQYDLGIDGKYINTGQTELYTRSSEEKLAIQGRSLPFEASDVVPLGFKATTEGTFTIAIDHVDGLFTGEQVILLRDNLTGEITDLKAGAYSFSTAAGTFESRFDVIYDGSLAVEGPIFNENSVVVYNDNGAIGINSGNIVMDNVKVFDTRGRLVAEMSDVNASQVSINAGQSNQVLIVKITSENKQVVTKKVIQ